MQAIAGADVFFLPMGAVLVLAMHAGFALREAGTVRRKNRVNSLVKILAGLAVSTLAYFFIGYAIAHGTGFFSSAAALSERGGFAPVKFLFLLGLAAMVPAIVSGGIAERARFWPQLAAGAVIVAFIYPLYEGIVWGGRFSVQAVLEASFGAGFHDYAGSVVVHALGGWLALGAVVAIGARRGRYPRDGRATAIPPSSIPFLALGCWLLALGWFGFHVMSAQALDKVSALVAMNSLMAMAGGVLGALVVGKNDPGFTHNGALAGLVAIAAGADVVHPIAALVIGAAAGVLFVIAVVLTQQRWQLDDALGVWPLHGLAGAWGGLACGIFGAQALGGLGGVSFLSQLIGTLGGVAAALMGGLAVYGLPKKWVDMRLREEDEIQGADRSVHRVSAQPEEE